MFKVETSCVSVDFRCLRTVQCLVLMAVSWAGRCPLLGLEGRSL